MRKTLSTLAILSAAICSADVVSTNTRAATEKWVSLRFASTQDLARALATQRVERVRDTAQPSRYFQEVVNGTGTVYEVTGPFTNLIVTLSEDFEDLINHTRPSWTNNVFPFYDAGWGGIVSTGVSYSIYESDFAYQWVSSGTELPATLFPENTEYASGTASVYADVYYSTNAIKHFSTEAELEAAKAACGVVLTNTVNEAVSNMTADISASTNAIIPYTRTVYGDITTTNEAGYAAFNANNAAVASYSALIPSSAVGSFTNIFRYNFNGVRKFGTLTNTAWFVKSGFGAGYKAVSTVVSVKDAAGNVLASSASQPVNIDPTVTTQAAITNTLALPLNVYSGTVEVACIAVSTNASFSVRLYTGGQYASSLSFGEAPIPYATVSDVSGLRLGGATNITDGVTSGTFIEATRTFDISAITGKAITNGQSGPLTLGPFVCTTNMLGQPSVLVNTDVPQWNATLAVRGALTVLDYATGNQMSYLDNNGFGFSAPATFGGNAGIGGTFSTTRLSSDLAGAVITQTEGGTVRNTIRAGGPSYIHDSLQIGKTNTAAVVVSQSSILFGPSIGGKQAHIFTDGTNCFFVNVNSVTNALTTN